MFKIYQLFKNHLALTISVVLGGILMLYPLYTRFLRIRLPQDLPHNLWNTQQYLTMFFFSITLLVWVYIFLKCLRLWLYETFTFIPAPTVNILFETVSNFTTNAVENFYRFLERAPFTRSFYNNILCPLILNLMFSINTRYRMILFTIIIRILPQFIILVALFLDLIIYHKFYFFYKCAILLLFPLIERYLVFWTTWFTDFNLHDVGKKTRLYVEELEVDQSTVTFIYYLLNVQYHYCLKDKHHIIDTTFHPVVKNVYFLILEPFWDSDNRQDSPDYNPESTLLRAMNEISHTIYPIVTFNKFYGIFRQEIYKKFLFWQSLAYVFIWSSALLYML